MSPCAWLTVEPRSAEMQALRRALRSRYRATCCTRRRKIPPMPFYTERKRYEQPIFGVKISSAATACPSALGVLRCEWSAPRVEPRFLAVFRISCLALGRF
jgi:hypothetical protein